MTKSDYAKQVLQAGVDLGITERGIVIGFATVYVESNWLNYANSKVPESLGIAHDAVGSDGYSVGLFQQQVVKGSSGWWWGDAATCMDPYKSATLFFQRLAKLNYNNTANTPGSYAQAVQESEYPDRYDKRIADAQSLYDSIGGETVTDPRPDFNEYWVESPSNQSRNGTTVDLWLLHTQEGGGGDDAADDLAQYLKVAANQVSYHYTASQASDGGVTVCDVVDTDLASWSVLSANNRSINFCFAGSRAAWTRDQWMAQSKAIDVAAYLAVQDCKKYNIPIVVIGAGGTYSTARAGIADHRYVTDVLKDGTHTDVGSNFPVDYFAERVNYWANPASDTDDDTTDTPAVTTPTPVVVGPADDQLVYRWNCLGGQTLVEAVAEIRDKVCGTNDKDKTGVVTA